MDDLLMGIDIGTTGAKSAIFDTEGKLLAVGNSEYELFIPKTDWAEQDPASWWNAVGVSTRNALRQIPDGPARLRGVAVSSQAPTLLPLDKHGKPLRHAMIWMDRRAEKEAQFLKTTLGDGVVERITGNRPDPFYVASKLLWYRRYEPENFSQTSLFIQANGFINYKLTNRFSMDNVHASLLQLRNHRDDTWSEELCKTVGVNPDLFPPIRQGHEILGEVTHEASDFTGLLPGTPVMIGTVDGSAAALEAGVVEEGIVAEMTGTSTVLLMPNESGIIEPAFITMPHAIPGLHLLLGALVSTGACLKWFRDKLGETELELSRKINISAYELLIRQAIVSKPGSGGVLFLPYMMGERSPIWHTNARGVFFGLSLSTSKGNLIRAILEGTSFALLHNIEIAKRSGITISEIRSIGGGTQSEVWNQIKADVLGIPVLIPETSIGAPFGDAILVGMGLGYYKNPQKSLKKMVKMKDRFTPNPKNHELYKGYFNLYKSIYRNLIQEFDSMASLENR